MEFWHLEIAIEGPPGSHVLWIGWRGRVPSEVPGSGGVFGEAGEVRWRRHVARGVERLIGAGSVRQA